MDTLILRQARLDDLDRIMILEQAGFAPGHREARDVYAGRIAAFPQGSLVACMGPRVVGCLFSEIWRPAAQPEANHFRLGHDIRERHDPLAGTELYVTSMTVDPACRGQRLGARVFGGALARLAVEFPGLASALLLVNESWGHARRIYTAAGFQEIARFAGFFGPGDGIVMRRALRTA